MLDLEKYINELFEKDKRLVHAFRNAPGKFNATSCLMEIEKEIRALFEKRRNLELTYHNLNHTLRVVSNAREISRHYDLNKDELFIVESAAWFHDIGYLILNDPKGHESLGAELAGKILNDNLVEGDIIADVKACIGATALPQHPETLLQKIICDADLYHFGTSDLFFQDALMHKEVELRINQPIDERTWIEGTIKLLESHHYHTEYCQKLLNQEKRFNLDKLKMILRKAI